MTPVWVITGVLAAWAVYNFAHGFISELRADPDRRETWKMTKALLRRRI